ncbi:uncharacterized protein TNCT_323521 [Trichonephila clavata]|uniref:DNA-directed DNA polymerase n=1 Tax=Trichonephila clavata TaxID=2740835 RepID=A0A8X6FMB8_TRICU|nr:uncharacterized protein TNCT_323521 [Trichonephila clavata]
MIPVQGYCNSTKFTRDSIRWLDFVTHTQGHRILHALNGTGEPKIAGYSVDSFCKETNTVYQYQDIDSCFGLVKCKVFSPNNLFHPLLPFRCNGKLMFPLCRTCAETLNQNICSHTDEERSITGTWVTVEVKKAREKEYKIIKIYEVYHFQSSSNDLFRSYIDLFLKIKQEASGYQKGCLTEQQKSEYVISYSEKENIYLDKNSIIIKDVFLPTPEIAAFQWTQSNNFVTHDNSTNIFIAAFTTCHALLKLYSEIEKLNESVLYFDTDSIIYKSDGINDPPLGNFLGEFTDELNGGTITSFVTEQFGFELRFGKRACFKYG